MFKGKTALITGSTAGIGFAVAERLAAGGCNVVLNGIAPPTEGDELAASVSERFGVEAVFDGTDVGDTAGVETMIAGAERRIGSIDILVNNAVHRVFGAVENTDPADWDRVMAVNLNSAFNATRCVLSGMKARGWGRIVNMSSIYGLKGAANRASYVVSKTALIGLTRAVALEVVDYDITCNAVCPGSVNTTQSAKTMQASIDGEGIDAEEAARRFLEGKQPTGRFVSAEGVAGFVEFLCGPGGADINGAVLPVDMAWSAA